VYLLFLLEKFKVEGFPFHDFKKSKIEGFSLKTKRRRFAFFIFSYSSPLVFCQMTGVRNPTFLTSLSSALLFSVLLDDRSWESNISTHLYHQWSSLVFYQMTGLRNPTFPSLSIFSSSFYLSIRTLLQFIQHTNPWPSSRSLSLHFTLYNIPEETFMS